MRDRHRNRGIAIILLGAVLAAARAFAEEPARWRPIGQVGGPTQALAVEGHYAYVGVGSRLVILDISNPASLVEVGMTPPFPYSVEDVAVSGTMAYVAAGGAGLRVVDVSSPSLPTEVGLWDSRGYANGVAVAGSIVYLADGPYGLRVVDVSQPSQPIEVGSAFPMNYAFDVAVQGHYAYLAAAGAGLLIADVSDPKRPGEVSSVATDGYAYGVAVAGSTAYVADGWEGVKTVNVADPARASLAGAYKTPGWALGIAVAGSSAYVADAFGGLRVLDVANPVHPVETASSEMRRGHAASVVVNGKTAYVADRNWGVRTVSLSADLKLPQIGGYRPITYAESVAVAGNYAYVGEANSGLRIVDISDPARPREVAAVDIPSNWNYVTVRGNYAYVGSIIYSGGGASLYIVDIADPLHPVVTGSVGGINGCRDLDIAGGIAYFATEWGLELVSVSDPTHPSSIAFLEMRPTLSAAGTTCGVAVKDAVAYVAASNVGLKMVDVSDPRQPRLAAAFATGLTNTVDVALGGGKAYVADGNRLVVLDMTDALHPTGVGSLYILGAEGVTLSGVLVYVAAGERGMVVVDVIDPARPAVVGTFTTQGFSHAVAVASDHAYVADGPNGLLILEKAASPAGATEDAFALTSSATTSGRPRAGTRPSPPPIVEGDWRVAPPSPNSAVRASGASCVVTLTADAGAGTLRQCLLDSPGGSTITFDPSAFPPAHPATIALETRLPELNRGGITIDASNAGVILDGSKTNWAGIFISSNNNAVKGLQIVHFPFDGVAIRNGRNNLIGGDRSRGSGPTGEGNIINLNARFGVSIEGSGTDDNVVTGNLIGTDRDGTAAAGNATAVVVNDGARNRIGGTTPGERNILSGNHGAGLSLGGQASSNVVIGNFIGTDLQGASAIPNGGQGVFVLEGPSNNRIGGADPGEGNVISGNVGSGVTLQGSSTNANLVLGNYVGTDASGAVALGNAAHGITIEGGAFNNVVQGNVSSGNAAAGIIISDSLSNYNAILGNRVGTDASGTRAIPNRGGGVSAGTPFNRIGGTRAEERNLVSGNDGTGINARSPGNVIRGNFIGTDITGRKPLGNGDVGVSMASGRSFLGGVRPEEANVIAANPHFGVQANSDYVYIAGNYIGTDLAREVAIGNVAGGVGGVGQHTFLQGNVIAHSLMTAEGGGGNGVAFRSPGRSTIRRNSIYDSARDGINGVTEPPPPIITSVSPWGVTGKACPGCDVEIFSDAENEGRVFEGTTVADASGVFTFTAPRLLTGPNATATATDSQGSTSQFSAARAVPPPPPPPPRRRAVRH